MSGKNNESTLLGKYNTNNAIFACFLKPFKKAENELNWVTSFLFSMQQQWRRSIQKLLFNWATMVCFANAAH